MNTGTIIAVVIIIVFLPVIAVIAYLAIKVSEMIIIAFIEILERAADRATNTYKEEKYKQPLKDIALRGSHCKIIIIIFNGVTRFNYRRLIHRISFQCNVCIGSHSPAFRID